MTLAKGVREILFLAKPKEKAGREAKLRACRKKEQGAGNWQRGIGITSKLSESLIELIKR